MSECKRSQIAKKRGSFSLCTLLILSTFTAAIAMPSASAAEVGNLGITGAKSPMPDSWGSSWDSITFTATVENFGAASAGAGRAMSWYVCDGNLAGPACISAKVAQGSFTVAQIAKDGVMDFTSAQLWNPSGSQGVHTVVYKFEVADQVASNDIFAYQINLTQSFVDIVIDLEHSPLEDIENVAIYNGSKVLNSGTDYQFKAKASASSCSTCGLNASLGWRLMDGNVTLKESYFWYNNIPAWGGFSEITRNLPLFNYEVEGTYTLEWGLFNSTGTPYGDLNSHNDITSITLVIDNTIDLEATSLLPGHDSSSLNYYYGEDMVETVVTNIGNLTVESVMVSLQVYSLQGTLESEEICTLVDLYPGVSGTCNYNLSIVGDNKIIRVVVPNQVIEGSDAYASNNMISEQTDILTGSISASISSENQQGIYTTGDYIQLTGKVGNTAAGPLNYSWWIAGIINLGYGPELNISAGDIGLGDHTISLRVLDAFGDLDSVHKSITVFDHLTLDNEPYYTGVAVTRASSYLNAESALPTIGVNYGIGGGNSPLLLLNFEILSTEDDSTEVGFERITLNLNLSALLSDNIDLSTVDIRSLNSMDDNIWEFISSPDEYTVNSDGTIDITMVENKVLLITGAIPEMEVDVGEIRTTQLPEGQIRLDWSPSGQMDNPYISGWNIYRLHADASGGTFFPDPEGSVSDFIWNELITGKLVASVPLTTSTWDDPYFLPSDLCASYAIMPANLEGTPDISKANVTFTSSGEPGLICGDAIDPTTVVENFRHTYRFTNDSDCFASQNNWMRCYEVNLTWTWPVHEAQGELTFNMYRVETRPDNVDFKFIEPIAENLISTPGEKGYYNESGMDYDGIRPYRTYYYVLTPIDSVGNEGTLVIYQSGNVERVQIDDQWWDYNQHLIPEPPAPPEPPLGLPWLGQLVEDMQDEEFQYAGVTLLVLVFVNLILLPLLIKRRKRLKRIIAARLRNQKANYMADEFDDFFD